MQNQIYYDHIPPYKRHKRSEGGAEKDKHSPFYQQQKYNQMTRSGYRLDLRERPSKRRDREDREEMRCRGEGGRGEGGRGEGGGEGDSRDGRKEGRTKLRLKSATEKYRGFAEEIALIDDTYIVGKKLGKGSFGVVHLGTHKWTGDPVAIKLEKINSKNKILEHEFKVYQEVYRPNNGISQCHHYGIEDDFCVMVVDLLGPSLGDLLEKCQGQFSMKTVLMIGDQMLNRLEYLHDHGYIHRDLKPDNMLIGRQHQYNQIYLIDYGLAKRFKQSDGRHLEYYEGNKFIGTARYASSNAHLGRSLSRRDDLISLGYILVYFAKGKLPWQRIGNKDDSKRKRYAQIKEMKLKLKPVELCEELPKEFSKYLEYCCQLEFTARPDYHALKGLFRGLMTKLGYQYDLIFDWNDDYCDSKKISSWNLVTPED